ncbi:hypothetical protein BSKO_03514 [Bryopsis sp. KO-2023]|nr:hypothetical protein BSKO_03514 [Bryopsis sp. KO-2023]
MIYYSKNYWALGLLGRFYGSAFPRAVIFAVLGTATLVALEYFADGTGFWEVRSHPYPFSTFAFSVGAVLIFRNNFAYQRFWEGRTQMQLMDSKWIDVATQAIFFDRGTLVDDADEKALWESKIFCESFVHLMSLLHALALQNFRRDWDLDNLSNHHTVESEPNMNIKIRRRMKHREVRSMLKTNGVSWWSRYWTYLWVGRHNLPADLFHIRSNRLERECYNHMLPLGVISGVSEAEKEVLGSSAPLNDISHRDISYWVCRNVKSLGRIIPGAGERVHVVNDWIHTLIMERRRAGGLKIPAPILTRMFSIMSQGMEGYENCRKLADTPFPFPYAQLVIALLIMFLVMLPFLFAGFILSDWLSVMLAFISLMTHFALNELAKDMEDPFIYDPNDLPLAKHHYDFNERMLAIARTSRPLSCIERDGFCLKSHVKRLVRPRSYSFNGTCPVSNGEGGGEPSQEDHMVECEPETFREGLTWRKLASYVDGREEQETN